jgi:ketosteroid isomerase-like protein
VEATRRRLLRAESSGLRVAAGYCKSMSQENVDVVRRALEAYERGDMEEMLSYLDPELEWHSAIVGGAEGNVYRGHEGFRRWNADFLEIFERVRNEWNEFRDLGDRVLAFGRVQARGRESGVEINSPMGWVVTVRGGKLLKAEGFLDPTQALKAAGLSE